MSIIDLLSVKPFAVIGHRGAAGRYPENTLKSIEYAIGLGVEIVEVDVRATRDGEIIVFHDPDLKRLFGISKSVGELDYSWIRNNLRLGSEYIPLLREVLELVKDRVGLFVEVKEPVITRRVVELISKYNMISDVAIISFYDEALVEAKQLIPNIVTGLIYFKPPGRLFDAKKLGANIVLPRYNIATLKANQLAHKLKLKVVVWTVNSEKLVYEMIRREVDGIASDYPDLLINIRKKLSG
ncbi:glycerophosphodiester phosphodiesterase [Staphylothermus hellenicus]|uniref:Glycerophosphoryl diester phosphodiesterase n=1 Tax=Staphylothermus hellenicus (strain DSM 12710 / JCM 10830 / BK20S6-10-b1 / P8) TaxID=591019 RepID=D7DAQ5_STAHD|nr:glycerophosphodiester phosphodiesterase [Staphylothermus hellenicus]ADI31252.1 glycerophosphoryl diester phosphodiesterase [Staphylothermus hellenicus DSM 12710]